jgi:hypothetical protein
MINDSGNFKPCNFTNFKNPELLRSGLRFAQLYKSRIASLGTSLRSAL